MNDSLIDDKPTFDGKLKLYFDWIVKYIGSVTI